MVTDKQFCFAVNFAGKKDWKAKKKTAEVFNFQLLEIGGCVFFFLPPCPQSQLILLGKEMFYGESFAKLTKITAVSNVTVCQGIKAFAIMLVLECD